MTHATSAKAGPRDLLFWPRAALENTIDFLAHVSRAVRCGHEAERLFRRPGARLHSLGVEREAAIQHAFRGFARR